MQFTKSIDAFKKAQQVIPGGVNSPVRAFKSVNLNPVFIQKGKGSILTDIDGNQYIDFLASWGPLIFGHAHDTILAAINEAAIKTAIETNHNVIPRPEPEIACGNALKGGYIVHPADAGPDSTNNDETIITLDKKNNQ